MQIFDWLISDQLQYLLNLYVFDCSVLHFLIENISNKNTKSISCFNEINEKILKKATGGISRVIWCSNQETGRFHEKLRDSRENWES